MFVVQSGVAIDDYLKRKILCWGCVVLTIFCFEAKVSRIPVTAVCDMVCDMVHVFWLVTLFWLAHFCSKCLATSNVLEKQLYEVVL